MSRAIVKALLLSIVLLSLILPGQALAQPNSTANCLSCHADFTTYTLKAGYPAPTIQWGAHYSGSNYDGSPATLPVNVTAGSSFELDFIFRDIADGTTNGGTEGNVRVNLALPTSWTAGSPGAGNQQPIASGWNTNWNNFPWVSMGTVFATPFPSSPTSYSVQFQLTNYNSSGTSVPGAAYDNGSTLAAPTPKDLDLVAEEMGADVLISVPAGATPGTYTIKFFGTGHVEATNKTEKASVIGTMTVNVVAAAGDSTAPVSGTVSVSPQSGTFVPAAFTVTTSFTDAESAVTACEYTLNGSTWTAGTVSGAGPYTCTANVTGQTNGAALTINMRATSSGGTGTATSIARTVDSAGPTDGTLTVTPGNTQNSLSWTAATDAASGLRASNTYDLRFLTGATAPTCATGTSVYLGTGTAYTHTPLTNGTQYSYRVCAYDNLNNVSAGATGTGTPTAGATPPDTAITAPAASAVLSTSPYSITGTATAGTNPLGDVQVSTNNGTSWNAATGTASWTYNWTLPSEDYVAHTLLAKARDNQGTPLEDPTPASVSIWVDNVAPTGLANSAPANSATGIATGTALTANTAAVADGNPGAKQYFFQIATDAGFTANLQQSTWQAASSWMPGTALSASTVYYWHVKVRDAANNESAYTTTWSFTTAAAANNTPAVPSALAQYQSDGTTVIASGGAATNNAVVFKATVSDPDANKVILEVDINLDGTPDCVSGAVTGPATATATCTALADGSYSWQARAKDSIGATSAWTAFTGGPPDFTVSLGIDIGIDTTPPTESGLTATPGDTVIALAWNPADDGAGSGLNPVNSYKVVRSTVATPADCSAAALYQGNLNLFNDSGLTNGTTYYYRVCAYDRVGNVSAGQTTSATPGSSCTVNTPTVSILGTDKTISVDGGFADYTVQITNNDVGACAAWNFDLVAVDSNGAAFYASTLATDPLNIVAGGTLQTTLRVTARPNQTNGATNNTSFYTAAGGGHAQSANSNAMTTTITVSGGGCVAAGSYLNANGDQLITSR